MGPSRLLSERPGPALETFLSRCTAAVPDLAVPAVRSAATAALSYHASIAADRVRLGDRQPLERRWYESLAAGRPDWSVYAGADYLGDLWACWVIYSRRYLRSLTAPDLTPTGRLEDDLGPVSRVADLGCGFGYTTAALRDLFPAATVIGTNLDGTVQTAIARHLAGSEGFRIEANLAAVGPVDIVFASEYFEHFPAPIDHLRAVLDSLQPSLLLVANTFGSRSIGHFPRYRVGKLLVDGRVTARAFAAELRRWGYDKVPTRLWNSRPAYWRLTRALREAR